LTNDQSQLPLPSGVSADVVRINSHDTLHNSMLNDKLPSVIKSEALAHAVNYDRRDEFDRVYQAVQLGRLHVYLITVTFGTSRPSFAGGAIEFPTIITEWNGQRFDHYPAIYAEDQYVSSEISSEFKKSHTI
jgi:hypothetical protein